MELECLQLINQLSHHLTAKLKKQGKFCEAFQQNLDSFNKILQLSFNIASQTQELVEKAKFDKEQDEIMKDVSDQEQFTEKQIHTMIQQKYLQLFFENEESEKNFLQMRVEKKILGEQLFLLVNYSFNFLNFARQITKEITKENQQQFEKDENQEDFLQTLILFGDYCQKKSNISQKMVGYSACMFSEEKSKEDATPEKKKTLKEIKLNLSYLKNSFHVALNFLSIFSNFEAILRLFEPNYKF